MNRLIAAIEAYSEARSRFHAQNERWSSAVCEEEKQRLALASAEDAYDSAVRLVTEVVDRAIANGVPLGAESWGDEGDDDAGEPDDPQR